MRAMKDTGIEWIGLIPQDWKITAFKRLGAPATGSTPSKDKSDYWDGEIPWLSSKDLKTTFLFDSEDHITDNAIKECGLTLFETGTLIFCVRSGILRHTFPVSVTMQPTTINQDLRALKPTEMADPSYLLYYLTGINDTIVSLYQKTGATVESIEMDWLSYLPVVLPSTEDQTTIVHYLNTKCAEIDALIAAKEKTNALLKERRQSIIYEAVTKGLDPTAPMKDSGVEWIGEVPDRWIPLRLKYCIRSIDSGTSVNAEDRPCSDNEMGVLKTSCVYSGVFNPIENKAILDSECERASCLVKKGTLIVSRMNTVDLIGACGYVEKDYPNLYLPDRLWMLSFSDDCIPKYMWYFLSSKYAKQYFASLCNGTSGSMQNISQEQLGSLVFFRPPIEEQESIVNELDALCASLDRVIEQNEESVRLFKRLRQSLIYEVVTGKIEV